jgi:hypothetical protein
MLVVYYRSLSAFPPACDPRGREIKPMAKGMNRKKETKKPKKKKA